MEDISFLNTLKMKYNYGDKLITALDKIIPKLILYYGKEYEHHIKKAIESTRIIECNSYQPLSSVLKALNPTIENKDKSIIRENLRQKSSIYLADPVIIYDELLQNYIIKDIKRYIILAHFHNLDSPKGIATLTHELVNLIRSYHDEFRIDDALLTVRNGLKISKKQIARTGNKISLELLSETNTGLETGIISYDEEKITSLVINDKYETFDYDLPKKVALVLCERLGLKNKIVQCGINKKTDIEDIYNTIPGLFKSLSELVDKALVEEEKNHNPEITKQEKEQVALTLLNINNEIGNNIIFFINTSIAQKDKKPVYT